MNYVKSAVSSLNPFALGNSDSKNADAKGTEGNAKGSLKVASSDIETAEFTEDQLRSKEGALAYLLRACPQ